MILRIGWILVLAAAVTPGCAPVGSATDAGCPDAVPRGECDNRGQQCFYGHPELGGVSAVCTCNADFIGSPDHLGSSWSCEAHSGF